MVKRVTKAVAVINGDVKGVIHFEQPVIVDLYGDDDSRKKLISAHFAHFRINGRSPNAYHVICMTTTPVTFSDCLSFDHFYIINIPNHREHSITALIYYSHIRR